MSTGRLLLFANPAIFNNLAPFATSGAVFADLLALDISAPDMVLLSFMCSENPNTWMLFIFKAEAGIDNIQNNVMNNTTRSIEDDLLCSLPPTIYIVVTSTMILGTSTMVYIFIKEYKKLMRNKVSHAEPSRPVRSEVIRNQRLIQRSESFPVFKSEVKENLRRSFLHLDRETAVDISKAKIVVSVHDISTQTSQQNLNNAGANQIKILAKQTFQKHFLRTAGFITTFSLAGLLIKCVSVITAGSSFRAFPEKISCICFDSFDHLF